MSEQLNYSDPRVRALVNRLHEQEDASHQHGTPLANASGDAGGGQRPRDTRPLLTRYLCQLQSLSLAGAFACFLPMALMLALMIPLQLGLQRVAVDRGIEGRWPIPAYGDLLDVSGRLNQPYTIHLRHGPDWSIGLVSTDEGRLFEFSCEPGGDDLSCLYPGRYADPSLDGHEVHLKYLVMSKWLYPSFNVTYTSGASANAVSQPRVPAAIVMETTVERNGALQKVLSYEDSVARLKRHMAPPSPFALVWTNWIPLSLILFLIPPALYRIVRGRVCAPVVPPAN